MERILSNTTGLVHRTHAGAPKALEDLLSRVTAVLTGTYHDSHRCCLIRSWHADVSGFDKVLGLDVTTVVESKDRLRDDLGRNDTGQLSDKFLLRI